MLFETIDNDGITKTFKLYNKGYEIFEWKVTAAHKYGRNSFVTTFRNKNAASGIHFILSKYNKITIILDDITITQMNISKFIKIIKDGEQNHGCLMDLPLVSGFCTRVWWESTCKSYELNHKISADKMDVYKQLLKLSDDFLKVCLIICYDIFYEEINND